MFVPVGERGMNMKSGFDPRVTPWAIDESNFPAAGSFDEKARFLIGYSILAPSGHNTQPWKYRIGSSSIDFLADHDSRLPVADPEDRELAISVGAAVMNLRVAAARFGLGCNVRYLQDPDDESILARAVLNGDPAKGQQLAGLFPSITSRRTNRFPFESRELDNASRSELQNIGTGKGAAFELITGTPARNAIADLVEKGDQLRMADRAFRVELARWIWTPGSGRSDGIAADGLGIPAFLSGLAPWMIRTFNSGRSSGRKDARLVRDAAAMVVFHSSEDRAGWLETGELMERFILTLAAGNMQYSFFSLAVELPDTRAELKSVTGIDNEPQVLIRIGYGPPPPSRPMPRRPLEQVIIS